MKLRARAMAAHVQAYSDSLTAALRHLDRISELAKEMVEEAMTKKRGVEGLRPMLTEIELCAAPMLKKLLEDVMEAGSVPSLQGSLREVEDNDEA